jgi:predicted amino acid dehydrogenase
VRNILTPWAINHFAKNDPSLFKNKKIGFYGGFIQYHLLEELQSHDARFRFADIYFASGAPIIIKSVAKLKSFLLKALPLYSRKELSRFNHCDFSKPILKKIPTFKDFFECDIYILNTTQLDYITLQDLRGKDVIVESLTPKVQKILESKNVGTIYQCSANFHEEHFHGFTYLEGLFQALKSENTPLTQTEIHDYIEKLNLRPRAIKINTENKPANRFAFIIHPLSSKDLLKIPGVNKLKKSTTLANKMEKAATYIPGFHYGQIKGIKSEYDGTLAIGDIYAVPETPKMMMSKSKRKMYNKLIDICKKADLRGNKLIGLGAYTKVFGDAGVTVNRHSPIPVTTGNSLSAASTLWAASYAVDKLGFIKKNDGKYNGTVMVVGATGSIGKVNSKILCQSWDKVIIVAPKIYKLIELADEMKEINPNCEIVYATSPNDYLNESDLIITTTSAQGKKILDIELVKPGCVICDVSRPFDISEDDARKRPDVLVIASGEVELPGEIDFKIDIGLSGNTVYACLAETALLAMEGLYESFSMSRDISYQKVFKIDELARKHGIRLSQIMGHQMEITDDEMELCRQHALKKRTLKEESTEFHAGDEGSRQL